MMYNQKFAAAIKVNGKVLREFKDEVFVPFSSEYSILLKNLNTVRALVNVYIDGDNIVPNGLVISAGQEIDLERAIRNGNLTEGNRLKFIERTGAVEQHRGVKLEDGIVRVEFEFERPGVNSWPTWNNIYTDVAKWQGATTGSAQGQGALRGWTSVSLNHTVGAASATFGSATAQASYNDVGITVPGSKSDQKFNTTHWNGSDGNRHVIVLRLLGETPDNKPVVTPVTVKAKPKCSTCGRQNKATAKFCQQCGTALEIFA